MSGVRIIAVMPHGPAYDYHKGEPPEFSWEKPGGGKVGFWSNEWMDVLGAEVLKNSSRHTWEVWQPDPLADKVYSARLPSGVTHVLFPAEERVFGAWPLSRAGIWCARLVSDLERLEGERAIVLLYGTYGFRIPLYMEILKALRAKKIPVFMRSGGMFRAPLTGFLALHRPLTYLRMAAEHLEIKRLLARADVVSEQSSAALAEVRKVYGGRVETLTMGCDFSFWRPPSESEKRVARSSLGIGAGKKVFFASGNFVPRKQLDRLAGVFASLGGREDFFLLIAGHGGEEESRRLSDLAGPMIRTGRALLHPYASGETLLSLYHAADVYVSVATDEGGPASVMKALACGLPVLSTPVGETADALRAASAGRLVPVRNYAAWKTAVEAALSGAMPAAMDLAAAREKYDWPRVAGRYVKVFEDLERTYFGGRQ
ncbi:MAG: hypothetical protein A2X31_05190 [Elusimicrobia bacterium GWB2_63_22]|nr:MAG: hypothetical protein A2X31_05190 [Elusimicrobia bacterium GWB2_63_22]